MQRFSLALIASVTALVVGGAWAQGGAGGGQGTASPGTGSTSATGKAVMQQQTAAQMRD